MGDRQPAPIFAASQGASWRVRDLLQAGADPMRATHTATPPSCTLP